jgi:hypothetical protein
VAHHTFTLNGCVMKSCLSCQSWTRGREETEIACVCGTFGDGRVEKAKARVGKDNNSFAVDHWCGACQATARRLANKCRYATMNRHFGDSGAGMDAGKLS